MKGRYVSITKGEKNTFTQVEKQMEILIEVLNLSLPVALMLFGAFFTLLGSGTDLPSIKTKIIVWRIVFLIIGLPSLLLGIISSLLLLYKIIFTATLAPPNFNYSIREVIIYCISLFIVSWISYVTYNKIKKNTYKLQTELVIDKEGRKTQANLLVKNKSKEGISCHAFLEKVVHNGENLDINKINPQGLYFRWDRKDQTLIADYATLSMGIPRIVYVLQVNGNDVFFEFQNNVRSESIKYGTYKITIGFYRKIGKNFTRFTNHVSSLKILSIDTGRETKIELSD